MGKINISNRKNSFDSKCLKDLEARIAKCGIAMGEAEEEYRRSLDRLEAGEPHNLRNQAEANFCREVYFAIEWEYSKLQHELELML